MQRSGCEEAKGTRGRDGGAGDHRRRDFEGKMFRQQYPLRHKTALGQGAVQELTASKSRFRHQVSSLLFPSVLRMG